MPQFLQQLAGDTDDLVDGLHHVDRDADGTGLIGDGTGNCLTDPPGGVGRELITFGVVKLFHSLDETQISLLDQVQEQHAAADVALCDGDDQTQVGLCQTLLAVLAVIDGLLEFGADLFGNLLAGGLQFIQLFFGGIAGAHTFRQLGLFIRCQQRNLADLFEVHADRIINAEAVYHGVGVDDLLLFHVLNIFLRGLNRFRDVFVRNQFNALILQDVIKLIQCFAVQLDAVQFHHLHSGEFALFLASLNEFIQLFGASNSLGNGSLCLFLLCNCLILVAHVASSMCFLSLNAISAPSSTSDRRMPFRLSVCMILM